MDIDRAIAFIRRHTSVDGAVGLAGGDADYPNYATALGRRLSLGDSDLRALQRGGFLHDIGMLAIPDSLLNKKAKLTAQEIAEHWDAINKV